MGEGSQSHLHQNKQGSQMWWHQLLSKPTDQCSLSPGVPDQPEQCKEALSYQRQTRASLACPKVLGSMPYTTNTAGRKTGQTGGGVG